MGQEADGAQMHLLSEAETTMTERTLGKLRVSAVGCECRGGRVLRPKDMSDAESIEVIHRYLDAGGKFLDAADMYGVVLATKFGNVRDPKGSSAAIRQGGGRVQRSQRRAAGSVSRVGQRRRLATSPQGPRVVSLPEFADGPE